VRPKSLPVAEWSDGTEIIILACSRRLTISGKPRGPIKILSGGCRSSLPTWRTCSGQPKFGANAFCVFRCAVRKLTSRPAKVSHFGSGLKRGIGLLRHVVYLRKRRVALLQIDTVIVSQPTISATSAAQPEVEPALAIIADRLWAAGSVRSVKVGAIGHELYEASPAKWQRIPANRYLATQSASPLHPNDVQRYPPIPARSATVSTSTSSPASSIRTFQQRHPANLPIIRTPPRPKPRNQRTRFAIPKLRCTPA